MKKLHKQLSDIELGMNSKITRRDLLHGFGALSAGALSMSVLSGCAVFSDHSKRPSASGTASKITKIEELSPPCRTGLRGNHQGSFEVAHQLGRYQKQDWGTALQTDTCLYDLVIVGAGISGLSAAHFHRKQYPQAKILIIDNHDDFGGHAKRNEFNLGGQTLLAHGGSQTLVEPSSYSKVVKDLLADIGVKIERLDKAYDQNFFKRHKLSAGIHFNKEKWGVDKIVPIDIGIFQGYLPVAPSPITTAEAVEQMPISAMAKVEFFELLTNKEDHLSEIKDKKQYLESISYQTLLLKHLNITEKHVFAILEDLSSDYGVGIDSIDAWSAISWVGLPGRSSLALEELEEGEAYIHHFPDGNASIARLMVRQMIPEVAPGSTMEDIVTAQFDYEKLDQSNASVRIRLNSTAIKVENIKGADSAQQISLKYVQNGQTYQVKGKACVLACNNSIIPYLCPEMPKAQREALDYQEKTPILYTSVAIRNWQAWQQLNIGAVVSPGSYHINAMLDFPVSLGEHQYAQNSNEAVIVHMERFPHVNNQGKTAREQHRLGRHELYTTSFETIERQVRNQLTSMFAGTGFNAAEDIIGITVNRWAHGYAYWYRSLFDTIYEDRDDKRHPHMIARQRFGKIAIANADSGAKAMLESAVEQGYRAVNELFQHH